MTLTAEVYENAWNDFLEAFKEVMDERDSLKEQLNDPTPEDSDG